MDTLVVKESDPLYPTYDMGLLPRSDLAEQLLLDSWDPLVCVACTNATCTCGFYITNLGRYVSSNGGQSTSCVLLGLLLNPCSICKTSLMFDNLDELAVGTGHLLYTVYFGLLRH